MTEIPQLSHSKKENTSVQIFCDEPGCNKSFKRTDHLTRHKRNHASKNLFTCTWSGCNKSFVRRDVWSKHTQRHVARQEKQKDLRNGPIQFLEIYTPTSNFDELSKKVTRSSNSPPISKNHEGCNLLDDQQFLSVPSMNYKFQNQQMFLKDNSSKGSESPIPNKQGKLYSSCINENFQE